MEENLITPNQEMNPHLDSPLRMELPQVMYDCSHIIDLESSNTSLNGKQKTEIQHNGTKQDLDVSYLRMELSFFYHFLIFAFLTM